MSSRRHIGLLLALALVAGLLAYGISRRVLAAAEPVGETAGLDWLKKEFSLTPAQLKIVQQLHIDYAPVCAGHCAAIAEAETALGKANSPEQLAAARAELQRLEKVCADSTRAHLSAVASVMPPAEARRFLALIEPKIAHAEGRTGAPDLNAGP